jgi:hypothetical protein
MAFINTVPVSEATGDVRAMYERSQADFGFVPNYAKAFSLRPPVMAAWVAFLGSIRGHLDPSSSRSQPPGPCRARTATWPPVGSCASASTRRPSLPRSWTTPRGGSRPRRRR